MTTAIPYPQLRFASDRSILIILDSGISPDGQASVLRLFKQLTAENIPGVLSIHPAYNSILLSFHPMVISGDKIFNCLQSILQRQDPVVLPESRQIEIPVCYGRSFGPDLHQVAIHTHLTEEEVIDYHSKKSYLVYFLGFSPGFPYLGGMPPEIAAPRLATPRRRVPEGSVAIGGKQTGIYPIPSPGGWQIIGQTPRRLYFPNRFPPTLLQMGDTIRFVPITSSEFAEIKSQEDSHG